MNRIVPLVIVFLALAVRGLAGAQADADTKPAPHEADRSVVGVLVMNAVTEIKLCDYAIEKTGNADVHSFCRSVSSDDARSAIEGMQLAARLGETDVKFEPAPQTPEMLDSLAQFSGQDFDRAFLLGRIEGAENNVNTIRYAVEFTAETAVKRYENAMLPRVERHLDEAETLLRRVSEQGP